MTRFVHDQFAKDLLEDLLAPWGEVKPSHKVGAEVHEIDVWFSPRSQAELPLSTLGLLGRFATQPASFEPFRNPADENEICDCLLKLLVLRGQMVRQCRRDKVPVDLSSLPKLWILTPTASEALLHRFSAQLIAEHWPAGVYFLGEALRTAIVVIHQLPKTSDTLWLRLLGRGKVQQSAIDELEALPVDSPFRAQALELLLNLRLILETRENANTDQDDQELIMRLAPLYQEQIAATIEKATQQGERRVIENLLRVRFGAIDDRLETVIDALLTLTPEEFTPLLLNLSQEQLIDRFGSSPSQ
ncbi:MAG: hypothetical protein ACO37W_06965 [Prochlorotrichaceae cyanobacterium]